MLKLSTPKLAARYRALVSQLNYAAEELARRNVEVDVEVKTVFQDPVNQNRIYVTGITRKEFI